LIDRLLEVADDPAPQLRAVVTTLLIKALDDPAEGEMIRLMVSSDAAGAILDPSGATEAKQHLDRLLRAALDRRAEQTGEAHLVRVLRDYLFERMESWAERTVDDAVNRRRAERLLVLADQPLLLAAAQRRGFMMGMSADDVRALARDRVGAPVTPETVTELWTQLERWRERTVELVGDDVIDRMDASS
jgi:hypothetical protein